MRAEQTVAALIVDRAIGQWRRRLECAIQQRGGHSKQSDVKTAKCDSYFKE